MSSTGPIFLSQLLFFPIKRFVIIAFPTVVSPVGTQFFLSNRSDPISRNDFGILRNVLNEICMNFKKHMISMCRIPFLIQKNVFTLAPLRFFAIFVYRYEECQGIYLQTGAPLLSSLDRLKAKSPSLNSQRSRYMGASCSNKALGTDFRRPSLAKRCASVRKYIP